MFNEASTIPRLADSLSRIQSESVEFVFSDNASTDGSADVARRYARDERFRVHRHERHVSIFASSMRSLALAQGRHALMIGGDDWVYPEAVDNFVQAVEPDFVYCTPFTREDSERKVENWYGWLDLAQMKDPFAHPNFQSMVNVDEMQYAVWPANCLPNADEYLLPTLEPQWSWVFRDVTERYPVRPWNFPLWHKSMSGNKNREERAGRERATLLAETSRVPRSGSWQGFVLTRKTANSLKRGFSVAIERNRLQRFNALILSTRTTDDVARGDLSALMGLVLLRWLPPPPVLLALAPGLDLLTRPAVRPFAHGIGNCLMRVVKRAQNRNQDTQ